MRHLAFITIITALICVSVGCANAETKESNPALEWVLHYDASWVKDFISPTNGQVLQGYVVQTNGAILVVIENQQHTAAVLYDIERAKQGYETNNRGFGRRSTDSNWVMWHQDDKGRIFESHGGVWTINRYREIISQTSSLNPIRLITWQNINDKPASMVQKVRINPDPPPATPTGARAR